MKTLVLNADMSPLRSCKWQDAAHMICGGRAELVAHNGIRVHPTMFMPTVIRLVSMIRVLWKKKVPWTKDHVHTRDSRTCQYCNTRLESKDLTIDHIIPKDQGGQNTWENTVTACFPCNNKKDNRTPSQAKMYLRKRPYQPTIMEFTLKTLELDGMTKILEELFQK